MVHKTEMPKHVHFQKPTGDFSTVILFIACVNIREGIVFHIDYIRKRKKETFLPLQDMKVLIGRRSTPAVERGAKRRVKMIFR